MAMTDGGVEPVSALGSKTKQKRSYSPRVLGTKAIGPDGLTVRERQFVGQMYLNGFKPVEACKALNLGGKRPDVEASRMMAKSRVHAAVLKRQEAVESKAEGTINQLVAELASMALAKFDGPLTASHKLEAIKTLGNHRGMFKQDQATVIPITFQFIGGPPLAGDVLTVEQASPPAVATDAPLLGKPERG